jgi:hypothetical protein
MKRMQVVPSLVDHFRPGDDFEVTPHRRTGATSLTNEIMATCCTDAAFLPNAHANIVCERRGRNSNGFSNMPSGALRAVELFWGNNPKEA